MLSIRIMATRYRFELADIHRSAIDGHRVYSALVRNNIYKVAGKRIGIDHANDGIRCSKLLDRKDQRQCRITVRRRRRSPIEATVTCMHILSDFDRLARLYRRDARQTFDLVKFTGVKCPDL